LHEELFRFLFFR